MAFDAATPDLSDVRQEALLGAYRYLADGGDPDDEGLARAAIGQVVKEVGLIVGPEMKEAIAAAIEDARQRAAEGFRPAPRTDYWRELGADARHRTPNERLRLCLLQLGIKQSPEGIVELWVRRAYGEGSSSAAEEAAIDKFDFLVTLPVAEDEGHLLPFNHQIAAALAPAQREDIRRLRPLVKGLITRARSRLLSKPEMARQARCVFEGHIEGRRDQQHSRGTSREARSSTPAHSGSRRTSSRSAGGGGSGDPPDADSSEPALGRQLLPVGASS